MLIGSVNSIFQKRKEVKNKILIAARQNNNQYDNLITLETQQLLLYEYMNNIWKIKAYKDASKNIL